MLIAGCSSGDGGSETPPPSQEPPPHHTPPNPSGLDARPSNTTCVAPERATGSATIGTQRAFPNIRFRNHAIEMLQAPGDSSRWFVAERFGFVQVFDNREDVAATTQFIDIDARVDSTCAECGLLGMAFHPDFPCDPARVSDVHHPESPTPRAGYSPLGIHLARRRAHARSRFRARHHHDQQRVRPSPRRSHWLRPRWFSLYEHG